MSTRSPRQSPRRRVLLINPPADPPTLRDYFCSTTPKADYLWHPIDLLALSGPLGARHEIAIIDAVAEGLDARAALERARGFGPDAAIQLVGSLTLGRDLAFAGDLRRSCGIDCLAVIGEPVLDAADALLAQAPAVDAALFDFLGPDAAALLGGRPDAVFNGAVRDGRRVVIRRERPRGSFHLGRVRHDLLPLRRYRVPPAAPSPFASVLCSFGCPYRCAYCNSGVGSLGYARREMDDLSAELEYLRRAGLRNLFFRDMSFGAEPAAARELLRRLQRARPGFCWTCYARPDRLDLDLLPEMARAGCRLIQFGVESARSEVLHGQQRASDPLRVEAAFQAARRCGIEAGAHFVLGLPGDSEAAIRETVDWALALDPAYASFNLFQSRHGTPSRARLGLDVMTASDASFGRPGPGAALSPDRLVRLRREAYQRFYLRPAFLHRRLSGSRNPAELRDLVRAAVGLARGLARGGRGR